MCNIDPCTDYEVNLIALHNQSYNLIGRSLAKFYAVIICFQDLVDLLKCKYPSVTRSIPSRKLSGGSSGSSNINSSIIVLFNSLAIISAVVPPQRITFPYMP